MEKITLTFSCDQDWEAMQPTRCGRFCSMCSREVHDLTNKTFAEIQKLKAADPSMCGMFTLEQLEPDLIPIEIPAANAVRCWLATAAAFFGLNLAEARARSSSNAPVEIVIDGAAVSTGEEAIGRSQYLPGDDPTGRDSRKRKPIKLFKRKPVKKSDTAAPARRKKKKIYFSKRFPFVHIRRARRFGGKF